MDESPISTTGLQGLGEDNVDTLDLDQPPADSTAASSMVPSMSAGSIRQDLVTAHQKAHKLHPYQREAVEEFIKVMSWFQLFSAVDMLLTNLQSSPMLCQLFHFIQLCTVENQIAGLKSVALPFVSSAPLLVRYFVIMFPISNLFLVRKTSRVLSLESYYRQS